MALVCLRPKDTLLFSSANQIYKITSFSGLLYKGEIISGFRRLPNSLVQSMGIIAYQNSPLTGFHAIQNDGRGGCGSRGRIVPEIQATLMHYRLNLIVRQVHHQL